MKKFDIVAIASVTGVVATVLGSLFFLSEQFDSRREVLVSATVLLASVSLGFLAGVYSKNLAQAAKNLARKRRVFISYPHTSSGKAKQIVELLRQSGVKVWLDAEQLRPGDLIQPEINKALEQSDSVVVILEGKPSPNLMYELGAAKARGLRIVPVVVGDAEIPSDLRYVRYVDFRDVQQASRELINAVG